MDTLYKGDVLNAYAKWHAADASPSTIISDGAYGVGGFPGDPKTPEGLGNWYRPHIKKWSKFASSQTALWLWNTEVGWAEVHPVLKANGWKYIQTITWNKGIGHIAGNVNGDTIRSFPVVTEICVLYQRSPEFFPLDTGPRMTMQEWMRSEWKRSGLPFNRSNAAAGVKDAASRKYFASDHNFYAPSREIMKKLADYANTHGRPLEPGEPEYFAGADYSTEKAWSRYRYQWTHTHGLTNVWDEPSLRSKERLKLDDGKNAHLNQKPLSLARRLITATTKENDVIWEPFGGTGTFTYAAREMGRKGYVSESNPEYQKIIEARLKTQE